MVKLEKKTFEQIGQELKEKGFTEIDAKALIYDVIIAWKELGKICKEAVTTGNTTTKEAKELLFNATKCRKGYCEKEKTHYDGGGKLKGICPICKTKPKEDK